MSALLADVPKTASTPELHMECSDDTKFGIVKKFTQWFKDAGYDVVDIDGARVTFSDGWGLVRASNTQPKLVLRFEADTQARLDEIRALIEGKLKEMM
jgi:phosphomannomutase/phosphoglucomutase